jgi:hypothetical protein
MSLFRFLRPSAVTLPADAQCTLADLQRDGVVKVPNFVSRDAVAEIRAFLENQQSTKVSATRRQYAPESLLNCARVCSLIEDHFLCSLASAYLGSVPIFTGVSAWWSLPDQAATQEDLSRAAQLFHFDYDWPAFLKFFIYLSDVSNDNGPFVYVVGTHEMKSDWRDGRVTDEYIDTQYGAKVRRFTGNAGDLIVADTVGYHKGERVRGEPRLMLQLEFAVSRLGASREFELLPKQKRPKTVPGRTFDVFAR